MRRLVARAAAALAAVLFLGVGSPQAAPVPVSVPNQNDWRCSTVDACRVATLFNLRVTSERELASQRLTIATPRGTLEVDYRRGQSLRNLIANNGWPVVARKKSATQVAKRKAPATQVAKQRKKAAPVAVATAATAPAIASVTPPTPTAPPPPPKGGQEITVATTTLTTDPKVAAAAPADTPTEAWIATLTRDLTTTKADLATTKVDLATANTRIGDLTSRVEKVGAAATAATARADGAEKALAAATTRIGELVTRIERTETTLRAQTTAFTAFEPRLAAIESGLNRIQTTSTERAQAGSTNTPITLGTLRGSFDRISPEVLAVVGLLLLAVIVALAFLVIDHFRTRAAVRRIGTDRALETPVSGARAATGRTFTGNKSVHVERGMVIPFQLAEGCILEQGAFGTSFDVIVTEDDRRPVLAPVGGATPASPFVLRGIAPWDAGFTDQVEAIEVATVTDGRIQYRTQRLTKMIADAVRGDAPAQSERIRRWLAARELVIDPESRPIVEHRRPELARAA